MLIHLIKKSDWAFLLDFVSPAFFKVIPPLELVSNATAMAKRTQNRELFHNAVVDMSSKFQHGLAHVKVVSGDLAERPAAHAFKNADEQTRRWLAEQIVKIYFGQIFAGGTLLLDLRLSRFSLNGNNLVWSPAPLMGVFSDAFIKSMSELYAGYYGGKSEQMMSALRNLGLDWAYDVFIEHFGEGDQTAVRFTMSHFIKTFHEIFMKCKTEKKNLKGEFVQLGVILGLMYESLETLDAPVDVRSAFHQVTSSL
ncbi:hypothetical protein EBU99_09555 [bacterium]|nr:hypothetical protein [bacterium]